MAWLKPQKSICLALLLFSNQLAGFPAPIRFRLKYLCHAFPVNKYLRNSPPRTKQFGVLDNLLLDVLLCSIAEYFNSLFVFSRAQRALENTAQLVKIFSDTTQQNVFKRQKLNQRRGSYSCKYGIPVFVLFVLSYFVLTNVPTLSSSLNEIVAVSSFPLFF